MDVPSHDMVWYRDMEDEIELLNRPLVDDGDGYGDGDGDGEIRSPPPMRCVADVVASRWLFYKLHVRYMLPETCIPT